MANRKWAVNYALNMDPISVVVRVERDRDETTGWNREDCEDWEAWGALAGARGASTATPRLSANYKFRNIHMCSTRWLHRRVTKVPGNSLSANETLKMPPPSNHASEY